MKKQVPALVAAFLVTTTIALGMFVIGANAAINKNSVPVQDAPTSSSNPDLQTNTQAQIEQMQSLINQYQEREQTYQNELNTTQAELDQAQATLQQYQSLLVFLQRQGLIQIDRQGRIFVPGD